MADTRPDDDVPELVSHFRDPPGWLAALTRFAEVAAAKAETPSDVHADYYRLARIVVEELPDSPERSGLLERLAARGRWR